MANKYMKKCSISLAINEIQIKTILSEWLSSRKQNNKCSEDAGKKNP
jgi:hypothetical protein